MNRHHFARHLPQRYLRGENDKPVKLRVLPPNRVANCGVPIPLPNVNILRQQRCIELRLMRVVMNQPTNTSGNRRENKKCNADFHLHIISVRFPHYPDWLPEVPQRPWPDPSTAASTPSLRMV